MDWLSQLFTLFVPFVITVWHLVPFVSLLIRQPAFRCTGCNVVLRIGCLEIGFHSFAARPATRSFECLELYQQIHLMMGLWFDIAVEGHFDGVQTQVRPDTPSFSFRSSQTRIQMLPIHWFDWLQIDHFNLNIFDDKQQVFIDIDSLPPGGPWPGYCVCEDVHPFESKPSRERILSRSGDDRQGPQHLVYALPSLSTFK